MFKPYKSRIFKVIAYHAKIKLFTKIRSSILHVVYAYNSFTNQLRVLNVMDWWTQIV